MNSNIDPIVWDLSEHYGRHMTTRSPRSRLQVTLAARTWSHLMPLARGSVEVPGLDLRVEQRDHTPERTREPGLDVAETSFSRYVQGVARGEDRWVGLPAFVMRGFRHRCFLVRRESGLHSLTQLAGTRIGVTGWPDSGNTWTRALLRRAGVALSEVTWTIAPLHGGPLAATRVGGQLPANVHVGPPGTSLLDLLGRGDLDVVVAPFVPELAGATGPPLRHLLPYVEAEEDYYRQTGYVPGIHLVTVRRELCEEQPWLPRAVVAALQESKEQWQGERRRYADTTPWMLQDLQRTDRTFGDDWMPYGVAANRDMVADFCTELFEQGLLPSRPDEEHVFGAYTDLTERTDEEST